MTPSCLIFGNSQAGCVIAASPAFHEKATFSWFATPGSVPTLRGATLTATTETISTNLPADHDIDAFPVLLYCALGAGSPRERRYNHPFFEISDRPTSDGVLKRLILSQTAAARALLRAVAARRPGAVVCQPWPRPAQGALWEGENPDLLAHWTRFCAFETQVLQEFCASINLHLLPYPAGTALFTPPALSHAHDPFHMNVDYGTQVLDLLTRHIAATPAA